MTAMTHEAVADAAQLAIVDIVRELNSELASVMVSTMCNSRRSWRAEELEAGSEPSADEEERLRFAHRVWRLVSATAPRDIARRWMATPHAALGCSPGLAIRDGRFDDVESAARAELP